MILLDTHVVHFYNLVTAIVQSRGRQYLSNSLDPVK